VCRDTNTPPCKTRHTHSVRIVQGAGGVRVASYLTFSESRTQWTPLTEPVSPEHRGPCGIHETPCAPPPIGDANQTLTATSRVLPAHLQRRQLGPQKCAALLALCRDTQSVLPPCKTRRIYIRRAYLTGRGAEDHTPPCKTRHMYTYTVCISKAEVLTITPLRTIHRVLDTPCGPDRERTLARSLACFRGVRTLAGLGGQASEAVYRGAVST
jgi:hypothetical protein